MMRGRQVCMRRVWWCGWLLVAMLAAGVVGCGDDEEAPEPHRPERFGERDGQQPEPNDAGPDDDLQFQPDDDGQVALPDDERQPAPEDRPITRVIFLSAGPQDLQIVYGEPIGTTPAQVTSGSLLERLNAPGDEPIRCTADEGFDGAFLHTPEGWQEPLEIRVNDQPQSPQQCRTAQYRTDTGTWLVVLIDMEGTADTADVMEPLREAAPDLGLDVSELQPADESPTP